MREGDEGPGPHQGGDNHKIAKIGYCHLKIFISRTTGPEKLKFIRKLHDIVEIQIWSNHDPWGYIFRKSLKSTSQESFDQKKGYLLESFLIWSKFKFVKIMLSWDMVGPQEGISV